MVAPGARYHGSGMTSMAKILNGVEIAAAIKAEVAEEVRALAAGGITPGLAVVLVGHVHGSEIYVRSKVKTSGELGIRSEMLTDRKSTRLNSSHLGISYAVFCLKKKNTR